MIAPLEMSWPLITEARVGVLVRDVATNIMRIRSPAIRSVPVMLRSHEKWLPLPIASEVRSERIYFNLYSTVIIIRVQFIGYHRTFLIRYYYIMNFTTWHGIKVRKFRYFLNFHVTL